MTVNEILDWCGGNAAELARRTKRSRSAVQGWIDRKTVPYAIQLEIETLTGGALRAEAICTRCGRPWESKPR